MNEKKRNVPKLRFPGFTEPWEQRKLGEVAKETSGGGTPKTSVSEYWVGDIPWIQSSDLIEDDIFTVRPQKFISQLGVQNSATKLVSANSIAVVTRVGVGKLAIVPFSYTTSQDFLSFSKLKENINFLGYALYNKLERLSHSTQGTAIKGITKSDLLEQKIMIPQNLQEQDKIGKTLKILDTLLTLHQRKLEHVKKLKAGLLQKMFPKDGESIPEVRFPGFTDPWEQRKLGELCDNFQSGKFIKAIEINDRGRFPVFGGNGLRGFTDRFNYDGEFAIIGRQGALCGNVILVSGKSYFTEHAIVVRANHQNITRFLYYVLGKMELGQYSDQSAQPGLAVKKLMNLNTFVPLSKEQLCISKFLYKLDILITLHQRKLEHLNDLKKGLLQQMFV